MLKICVIANKRDLKENYSKFIDSCDKVVRINKMDNLSSGLTGTKTDIVFTVTGRDYFRYTRKFRNVDTLRKAKVIFCPQDEYIVRQYVSRECIKDWEILKGDSETERWMTTSKAVHYLINAYPNKNIYFLGDIERRKRTTSVWHNKPHKEDIFFDRLINKGILIPILGNHDFINNE